MKIPTIYEKINQPGFEGYYYAHIPTLGLTTHGIGTTDAQAAAKDLLNLWFAEKKEKNEFNQESIYSPPLHNANR